MNKDLEKVIHFFLRYGVWILALAWIVAAISREFAQRKLAKRTEGRPDRRKLLIWVLLGSVVLGLGFLAI